MFAHELELRMLTAKKQQIKLEIEVNLLRWKAQKLKEISNMVGSVKLGPAN